MKISIKEIDEFERAKKEKLKPLDLKILDHLSQNNDSAFELHDIMVALQPEFSTSSGSMVDHVLTVANLLVYANELDKLEKDKKIRKILYKSKFYYTLEKARTNPPFIRGLD